MKRPLAPAEEKMRGEGSSEEITEERMWSKRPDGIAIKMPTEKKSGEFVILELKTMSNITDQYVSRAQRIAEDQYVSIEEYANILKGMYSIRFNGRPADGGTSTQTHSVPNGPMPPLITSLLA